MKEFNIDESNDDLTDALSDIYLTLVENLIVSDYSEFDKILYDNIWDLYEGYDYEK